MNAFRKLSLGLAACLIAATAAIFAGCTSLEEIRTVHQERAIPASEIKELNPNLGCKSSSDTADDRRNSIEDYGDFWAGYVEFDDEGWLYSSNQKSNQLNAVISRLQAELGNPIYADTDFLVVAFVHGWHHNANDTDCNVHEFRSMLKLANERYAAAAADQGPGPHVVRQRRIVGIYAGWRGESINTEILNLTTVLDRRNAAERVAKGDVRELFAQLRELQIRATNATNRDVKGKPLPPRADRMRTVAIGHSFGGLVAFHGLSPAVLNELSLTKPKPQPTPNDPVPNCAPAVQRPTAVLAKGADLGLAPEGASSGVALAAVPHSSASAVADSVASAATVERQAPVFPDMLILINPAFEATRFETLHELMRPAGCPAYPSDRPKVVVVTADNDYATGAVFTAGREVLTLLEKYPSEYGVGSRKTRERDANIHAIGFVERYRTHRLCLKKGKDGEFHAVASFMPPADAEWKFERFAPVWVVRAPPDIVYKHNGFLYAAQDQSRNPISMETAANTDGAVVHPYLLEWLVNLHLHGPDVTSDAMTLDDSCPENSGSR